MIWVILSVIIPLLILRLVPHLYIYNIVWGWIPGPIYDEQIRFSSVLFLHRIFVLTLSTLFILAGLQISGIRSRILKPLYCILLPLLIIINVVLYHSGTIRTLYDIEMELGHGVKTNHFQITFDSGLQLTDEELQYWTFWHEFHASELRSLLKVDPYTQPIRSIMYSDVWQKQHYTGAKYTSYVPTWNSTPQLHMDRQTAHYILRHELVHVYARLFGMPVINASFNMGLTEGLAVAFEDPRVLSSTRNDLIINSGVEINSELIDNVLGYFGFYSGRSFVNYSVSGSFIRYVYDESDLNQIKCSYSSLRISQCIDNIDELKCGWLDMITSIPPDSTLRPIARTLFERESIFEKKCARFISYAEAELDQIDKLLFRNQKSEAYARVKSLQTRYPASMSLWLLGTSIAMQADYPVMHYHTEGLQTSLDSIQYYLRMSDIQVHLGEYDQAVKYINEIFESKPNQADLNRIHRFFYNRGVYLQKDAEDISVSSLIQIEKINMNVWKEYLNIILGKGDLSEIKYPENVNHLIAFRSTRGIYFKKHEISGYLMDHVDVLDQSSLRILLDQYIPQVSSAQELWVFDRLIRRYSEVSFGSNIVNQIELYDRAADFAVNK